VAGTSLTPGLRAMIDRAGAAAPFAPAGRLLADLAGHRAAGRVTTVRAVGDCLAPGTIAAAVWSGRRAAEEFDGPAAPADVPFRREITALDDAGPR